VVRALRDAVPRLKQAEQPRSIVLLSPVLALPEELEKDVSILDFPLPSLEEIHGLLEQMIAANREQSRITIDLTPDQSENLAHAALGLTLQEAENAFARAMVDDGRLDASDVEVILAEKQQIIRKSGILEYVRSDVTADSVGGLDNLKRWLVKRDRSWLESARKYGLPAPKGVLITGVPGCGKSLTAKAVSAMWQLPLLRLDMGRVFSSLVGSSEENVRRAIRLAEALAPSILWIDEIEKGLASNTQGDSGTSSRVFGTFLTWMQEKTRAVFVIATANNIQVLPPELLRKGRFDEIFFVDLPTWPERVAILRVHLARRLVNEEVAAEFALSDENIGRLASLTEGFVGAELEQLVIAGLFEAFSGKRPVRMEDFERAIETTVPLSVTQAEQVQALRAWANVRAVAATPPDAQPTPPAPTDDAGSAPARGGRQVEF
jgi:SpoVK/Ycf46/Vps4 family AAA+-type ATPase